MAKNDFFANLSHLCYVLPMTTGHQKLEQSLRNAGQSVTAPRKAVFSAMLGRGPMSVYAVLSACASQADRASIYRTLALFRQLGIIQDLVVGGHKVIELSEEFSGHHHHLYCTACGKSIDITDRLIERRLDGVAEVYGFLARAHQVEVSGLCANCR